MLLLSDEDAREIGAAITKEEERTSGEIVAVLAAQSGSYRLLPLFLSAFIALLVPLILIYLPLITQGRLFVWSADRIYFLQLVVFLALAFTLSQRPLRYWIVPRSLKVKWARAHALEQFAAQEMHTTQGRTGVMIFVSVVEHYAEIIADKGIYEKVPPGAWQDIVSELVTMIEDKQPRAGFLAAIEASGALLHEHFPPGTGNEDELTNHLIVIE